MDYFIYLATLFSIYGLLAMSLNLVLGYVGLLSITHAAFYGIGAYSTAILIKSYELNFFIALAGGAFISMIIASMIGFVMSKFDGDYYALASIGFASISWSVFLNWDELTRGPLGISGISKPEIFGISFSQPQTFMTLTLLFLIGSYFLFKKISDSSFGRILKAIREDEKVTEVFGYKSLYYKLTIFIISAAFAAIAGGLYASFVTFIDPSTFTLVESIFIIALVILGGLGSLEGSLLGALVLVLLPELLRFVGFPVELAAQIRLAFYGLVLLLLMMYRPRGLIGEYKL